MAIELFDKQFGKVNGLADKRIDELVAFKEVISKKAIAFLQQLDDFKEFFKTFAADKKPNCKTCPSSRRV